MTLTEELAQLAAVGALGVLRPEARLADIAAEYGEPEDLGPVSQRRRWPRRFGVGSVELLVCECRTLRSLTLSLASDEVTLPGPGHGQLRRFGSHVTESALVSAMHRMCCHGKSKEYDFGQRDLETAPAEHVRVCFAFVDRETYDGPPLEEWILAKAGFWALGHGECSGPGAGDGAGRG
ncbi:hypothetical protein ACIPW9_19565 [Streptomyces sp. NPDC090052]|uniref:hypothetical protein n=1 Tax=Streptomyces sp. NPDC090052 TaxID=3365931 RepID=UPI0038066541